MTPGREGNPGTEAAPLRGPVGSSADNPCIIVALLLARTLGDCIDHHVFAASTALLFDHSRLFVYYRDDRPYKSQIAAMNPMITRAWALSEKDTFPFDAFDDRSGAPVGADDPGWAALGAGSPHIVLTPSMMQRTMLPAFPNRARLRIPAEHVGALDQRLRDAGVDPDRWFCVLHYREPTYGLRGAESDRDIGPRDPMAMTDHIIRDLGGQVVRIGHPGMQPFPAQDGFIDLADAENPGMLHAYAVSRARFFFELSPSGPAHFAAAFGVPLARCNAVLGWGPLEADSLVLLRRFLDREGKPIPLRHIVESELLTRATEGRYRDGQGVGLQPNSLDELRQAAQAMVSQTVDCPGWRVPSRPALNPRPNRFDWPLPHGYRHEIAAYWDTSDDGGGSGGGS